MLSDIFFIVYNLNQIIIAHQGHVIDSFETMCPLAVQVAEAQVETLQL